MREAQEIARAAGTVGDDLDTSAKTFKEKTPLFFMLSVLQGKHNLILYDLYI